MAVSHKLELRSGVGTDVGKEREVNQDRAAFAGPLAVLADGMGGHKAGETAAQMSVDEVIAKAGNLTGSDLVAVFKEANSKVNEGAKDPEFERMGTTLVAVSLQQDGAIAVANVGDSRAYLLRDGYLAQITEDHSFVEDLVRQGRITPEEAAVHPNRNILTRALGVSPEVEVDTFLVDPKPGDRFLLCSDGLFNEVDEPDFTQILLDNPDPGVAAQKLIEAALETPCRDNVTVLVVDAIIEGSAGAPPQQQESTFAAEGATQQLPIADISQDDVDTQTFQTVEADESIEAELSQVAQAVASDPTMELAKVNAEDAPIPENGESGLITSRLDFEEITAEEDSEDLESSTSILEDQQDEGTLGLEEFGEEGFPIAPSTRPKGPKRRSSRGLGVLAAVLVIAVLGVGTYLGATIYSDASYFVEDTESGLAVFNGRPGGFLWIEPIQVQTTDVKTADLSEAALGSLEAHEPFGSEQEALDFVEGLIRDSAETRPGEEAEESTVPVVTVPLGQVRDLDASTTTKPPNP